MLSRIYDIVSMVVGDSKQGGYVDSNQYQYNCPWCADDNGGEADGKYNLEVNLEMGKFHCWKCEAKGKLSYLLRKWGSRNIVKDYYNEVKSLKEGKLYNLNLFSDDGSSVLTDDGEEIRLPEQYCKLEVKRCGDRRLLAFLQKRRIGQDLIDRYNIGYVGYDPDRSGMSNRIIVPSYDSTGALNYWVGRDFTGRKGVISYKNAKADKEKIIFQEDKIDWDATIYICEGVLDCIRYPNTISLLGKSLSRTSYLYQRLHSRANGKIVICLDGDTRIDETKRIYRLLNTGRLKGHIRYIRLGEAPIPEKDFSELYEKYGQAGMIKAFRTERDFKEIELLY